MSTFSDPKNYFFNVISNNNNMNNKSNIRHNDNNCNYNNTIENRDMVHTSTFVLDFLLIHTWLISKCY